jgi:hypothetical protein
MSASSAATENPKQDAERSAKASSAPGWLVGLAKFGYAARGAIYVIIGILALLQAFGEGGGTTGSKGAIASILEAPAGQVLLWLMVVGLVGYSVWRALQAILDADHHGTDGKGLVVRVGLLVSSFTHFALAFYAGSIALGSGGGGSGSGSGGGGKEGLVAMMLGWPAGKWIVVFAGLCIIGAGVAHAVKAFKEKYEERFVIDPSTMEKIEWVCKFGLVARSVVFGIIGSMMIYAAWTQNPENAGGVAEVLQNLSEGSYGWILLAIIAAGLLCFGLYSIFEAIYRKIDDPWEGSAT